MTEYTLQAGGVLTHCRSVHAAGAKIPLIVIHGGPGMSCDYLHGMDVLADDRFSVHYYDHIGSGRSAQLANGQTPSISHMLRQLQDIVSELAKDGPYVLLSHSSGAAFAIEHSASRPSGLAKLILYSGAASGPDMAESLSRRLNALPGPYADALRNPEQADRETFQSAFTAFLTRHFCRVPLSLATKTSLDFLAKRPETSHALWGSSVFHLTGAFRDWTAKARLKFVESPSLVLSGEFDEFDEICIGNLASGLSHVKSHVFPECSHLAHEEDANAFFSVVKAFLRD